MTGFILLSPVFLFWLQAPKGCYGRPDISYAILIDAGSNGSRMYIYKYELNRNGKVDSVDDVEELAKSLGKPKPGLLSMLKSSLLLGSTTVMKYRKKKKNDFLKLCQNKGLGELVLKI